MGLKVFLLDDHTVLRTGLRMLLETQPDLEVVGEAGDAATGIEGIRLAQPELVILDLSLPGMSGLEVLQLLTAEMPQLRVVVLTMHDDAEFVRSALTHGARGYVLKRAADTELLTAIRQVAMGESYVYPSLAAKLVPIAEQRQVGARLSSREQEVLQLIAQGFTHQEIATQLSLSVKTVESHKARITEKLQLRTRAELVRYALNKGLV